MKKTPLVSIITPTFNLLKNKRKDFFIQMLNSVHMQSYENIEHVIIDGESSDGTFDILNEYSKKKWITFISEKDKSIYDAMNKGICISKGKYIFFLNSDDYFITQEAVHDSVNLLETTKADYSFAICLMKDIGGDWLFGNNIALFWNRMPFNHQTMFCKKSVLERFSGFDLKYKFAADYDFILKCIFNDLPYCFLNKTISAFRSGGATLQNKQESQLEQAQCLIEHCREIFHFPSIDPVLHLILTGAGNQSFLKAMRHYMIEQKFKNFDVNLLSVPSLEKQIRLFGVLPILKITEKLV